VPLKEPIDLDKAGEEDIERQRLIVEEYLGNGEGRKRMDRGEEVPWQLQWAQKKN
jgi:hypothetical protein